MNTRLRMGMLVAVLSIALLPVGQARAAEALRKELAGIAATVAGVLKGRDQDTISVGQFTGPATFPTSAGPGIAQALTEEFQKLDIVVKAVAPLGIEGRYLVTDLDVPDGDRPGRNQTVLAVRIQGTVVDQAGQVIAGFTSGEVADVPVVDGKFQIDVPDEQTVLEVTGVTASLPPDEPAKDRAQRIREIVQPDPAGAPAQADPPPTARLDGSRVFAAPGNDYAVEVLVNGRPRPAQLIDGLPFVEVGQNEFYVIRLVNNTPYEAAVRLTIDGLSTFAFSDLRHEDGPKAGQPRFNLWVVPPRGVKVVRGWHRTHERADSFLVTGYAESAAATLNHTADIGTITATFAACWPSDAPPPTDEPPRRKGAPLATGIGPPVQQNIRGLERTIGVVRAAVSVRYAKP
jgi:hypothetical protein